jgi:hypothetical protein
VPIDVAHLLGLNRGCVHEHAEFQHFIRSRDIADTKPDTTNGHHCKNSTVIHDFTPQVLIRHSPDDRLHPTIWHVACPPYDGVCDIGTAVMTLAAGLIAQRSLSDQTTSPLRQQFSCQLPTPSERRGPQRRADGNGRRAAIRRPANPTGRHAAVDGRAGQVDAKLPPDLTLMPCAPK